MGRFLKNWWVLTLGLVLILLLLFGWGLPVFVAFFRALWVRLSLCGLVLLGWGLLAFLRLRRARRASAALAGELVRESEADVEGRALGSRMQEALAALRGASGKKRDYLYSRPWYVIIGPPGAGKTTALLNSGLRFPFAEQALKGVGGTRNLDFWFADEAALVDTAGRYTTQDSNYEVDSHGWTSFLSLLKKHRPLQPINGIIVAIGVDELIRSDRAAIDAHAAAVMRRLRELRTTLEVSAPVYVLLTKADLLAGFTEYFDDLDFEGRRAVLGATLPFSAGKPDSAALARAFDRMAQAVTDRQAKRLFEEVDANRRSLLLGFPSQLQSLRARLMRFLDGAFVSSESGGVLRGFYLTSGVQQGAPLDRILSGMAEVYDRPNEQRAGASGKAYFLNRLLADVVFPEAGLVQMDPRARSRQRARLAAMLGLIAFVSVVTLAAWTVSYAKNRAFQDELLAATERVQRQIRDSGVKLDQVREDDADLAQVRPVLDSLRALPQGYDSVHSGGPPLSMRFGLFQSGLSRRAEEAYLKGLRRIMLPRVMLRLESYMAAKNGDAMNLYEPFKVYLMLGGQAPHFDPTGVSAWIRGDWAGELYPGADSGPDREALAGHLRVLLADPNMAREWQAGKAPLNGDLVAQVRPQIQAMSVSDRAYAVMRQKAAREGSPWLMAGAIQPGDAKAFSNPDAVMQIQVPYFFTRPGYEKSYRLALATVQRDVEQDAWVFGSNAQSLRSEIGNLRPAIAGMYARDYIAAWEQVVAALKPADYFQDLAAFGAFTKSPSPLKSILSEVKRNTSFGGGVGAAGSRLVGQRLARVRGGQFVSDMQAGRETGLDAGDEIQTHFAELHEYVGDTGRAAPIDDFVGAVKEAGTAVEAARSGIGTGGSGSLDAAMAAAVAKVRAAAAIGAPPQLKSFLDSTTKGGSEAQVSTATGAVTQAYASAILPECKGVAQERYPFFGTSKTDADMAGVMRVFSAGGVIDAFLRDRLASLIDTSGPVWRWRSDSPLSASLDPSTPSEFAKASEISDLLRAGLSLKVAVERMGSDTVSAEFSSGASTVRFDEGATAPRPVAWATQSTAEAYVSLQPRAAGTSAVRIEAEGPWALFRLIDKADQQNVGEHAIRATFRSGSQWATFLISLPGKSNPFSRGSFWSFRCPLSL